MSMPNSSDATHLYFSTSPTSLPYSDIFNPGDSYCLVLLPSPAFPVLEHHCHSWSRCAWEMRLAESISWCKATQRLELAALGDSIWHMAAAGNTSVTNKAFPTNKKRDENIIIITSNSNTPGILVWDWLQGVHPWHPVIFWSCRLFSLITLLLLPLNLLC